MTMSKKHLLLACGLITILLTMTTQTGCNEVNPEYLVRLDSLDEKIVLTEKYLAIDYTTIASREQYITKHLVYMAKYYDRTMTKDFGNNLTKYKAIKKTYANFLNRYSDLVSETKALKTQAADLRTSVTKNQITKAEFKQYYHAESTDIDEHLLFTKRLNQSIHGLEPEYQRISRMVGVEIV
ncbi:MAG: CRISPR/Cas system CSM-associated protein Csm4 (group 5 of RAMP superfamily), partial [Bacteroidia bacterium]